MIRAVWNETVIAQSSTTRRVEGNHYFPANSVRWEHLETSDERSLCFWKGKARYYDVVVDGARIPGGAWQYPKPLPLARRIRDHVAFWRGVSIERDD